MDVTADRGARPRARSGAVPRDQAGPTGGCVNLVAAGHTTTDDRPSRARTTADRMSGVSPSAVTTARATRDAPAAAGGPAPAFAPDPPGLPT
ncbi:hypothetical protein [Goodfellowiella coeruleoviolacea]|uniref:Uncharacterized protein n=1 Tax=Goodfellowiella coeruleoviolacea TaxID=334858 RepID=A0AAE3GF90_9PSEU|nr:hypothetical protein [Goodfellowiella coeruleoviolacea]MCP2166244.1 hypothetical protein [Goodfellowiella coeruleoviolacea]